MEKLIKNIIKILLTIFFISYLLFMLRTTLGKILIGICAVSMALSILFMDLSKKSKEKIRAEKLGRIAEIFTILMFITGILIMISFFYPGSSYIEHYSFP